MRSSDTPDNPEKTLNASQHRKQEEGKTPRQSASQGRETARERSRRTGEVEEAEGEHSSGRKEAKVRGRGAPAEDVGGQGEPQVNDEDDVAERAPQVHKEHRRTSGTERGSDRKGQNASEEASSARIRDVHSSADGRPSEKDADGHSNVRTTHRRSEKLKERETPAAAAAEGQQGEDSKQQIAEVSREKRPEDSSPGEDEGKEEDEIRPPQENDGGETASPSPERHPASNENSEADRETLALQKHVKELLRAVEAEAATTGVRGHGSQRGSVMALKERGLVRQLKGEFVPREVPEETIRGTPISMRRKGDLSEDGSPKSRGSVKRRHRRRSVPGHLSDQSNRSPRTARDDRGRGSGRGGEKGGRGNDERGETRKGLDKRGSIVDGSDTPRRRASRDEAKRLSKEGEESIDERPSPPGRGEDKKDGGETERAGDGDGLDHLDKSRERLQAGTRRADSPKKDRKEKSRRSGRRASQVSTSAPEEEKPLRRSSQGEENGLMPPREKKVFSRSTSKGETSQEETRLEDKHDSRDESKRQSSSPDGECAREPRQREKRKDQKQEERGGSLEPPHMPRSRKSHSRSGQRRSSAEAGDGSRAEDRDSSLRADSRHRRHKRSSRRSSAEGRPEDEVSQGEDGQGKDRTEYRRRRERSDSRDTSRAASTPGSDRERRHSRRQSMTHRHPDGASVLDDSALAGPDDANVTTLIAKAMRELNAVDFLTRRPDGVGRRAAERARATQDRLENDVRRILKALAAAKEANLAEAERKVDALESGQVEIRVLPKRGDSPRSSVEDLTVKTVKDRPTAAKKTVAARQLQQLAELRRKTADVSAAMPGVKAFRPLKSAPGKTKPPSPVFPAKKLGVTRRNPGHDEHGKSPVLPSSPRRKGSLLSVPPG
ncbi:hypothetical protein CSUI_003804 [Cystoisospora suis]|uniref:Uncharacterized protein n=1 Tax=Cystoisospora suis TaxID=483139 RepID=A0A2C6KZI1_9APIC|nr:hypothetical protein CSUI_003804 [Cystoisospora suis]